jgi:hypothetical protein
MKKCVVAILLLILLCSTVSCAPIATNTSVHTETQTETPTPTPTLTHTPIPSKIIQDWEISVNSVIWDGPKVTVDLSVTNIGKNVGSFPYVFFLDDSYRMDFSFSNGRVFLANYYPADTKKAKLITEVNPKSGTVTLYYVGPETPEWGSPLFELGSPK